MDPTDETLMAAYCSGDSGAFDRLYARHKAPVYRYIGRLLRDTGDPDALFQEVWFRVVHHRNAWSRSRGFKPWLFAIAHNIAIDHLRSAGRQPGEPLDTVPELASRQPDIDRWQIIRDCVERLLGLLSELPEAQRSAFLLKEEAGLSLQEIARVADVGRETIKSRLRYALQTLRRGLEDCEHV
jgi:RNA polymerase sigma-70 factor (ECF subfamily)